MGKKQKNKTPSSQRPFVSVCTPTFNRRPFIPIAFEIFKNQDYPKSRLEWIIVDDGTDPIADLVQSSGIPQIKHHRVNEKMSLGKKRNYMHSLINPKTEYLIYFDDDDWYPHDRISHSIEMLEKNPSCLIAGSSELYCYFKAIKDQHEPARLIQFGPYTANHSTAGTFCFHRKLLTISKYDDLKELAEERDFLKEYTIPLCQLNPLKTILVFSHEHNTFDKRNLLKEPSNPFMKDSEKTVDSFFRANHPVDQRIKRFFMEEIDDLLANYDMGEAKHKPNVLRQIEEIKIQRVQAQMQTQTQDQPQAPVNSPQIILYKPGEPPRVLTMGEIQQLLQSHQHQLDYLTKHTKDMEEQCELLQMKLTARFSEKL